MVIYGSVCSGIEAATVAWKPLGWHAAWFAEIDPYPSAVLAHHYSDVPNLGDFRKIGAEHGPIDLLVGGTPCEDFSIAGLRKGLAGENGNLAIEFIRLVERIRPRWLVWENVPHILHIDKGRAFGTFLGGLAECGYGWAYRILDAQYFGVPQRRRRVFVVGHSGGLWQRATAVLFECESLSGDPPSSRKKRPVIARTVTTQSYVVYSGGEQRLRTEDKYIVAFDWQAGSGRDRETGKDRQYIVRAGDYAGAVGATRRDAVMVWDPRNITSKDNRSWVDVGLSSPTLHTTPMAIAGPVVRQLTPLESERLQGFPDDWTLVPYGRRSMSDSRRYMMLGKSMAVPCMRWIGERIEQVEASIAQ